MPVKRNISHIDTQAHTHVCTYTRVVEHPIICSDSFQQVQNASAKFITFIEDISAWIQANFPHSVFFGFFCFVFFPPSAADSILSEVPGTTSFRGL